MNDKWEGRVIVVLHMHVVAMTYGVTHVDMSLSLRWQMQLLFPLRVKRTKTDKKFFQCMSFFSQIRKHCLLKVYGLCDVLGLK